MDNDNLKIFYQKKKSECEQLIRYRIWDGIDSNNLKSWLRNFNTQEERNFAALVLEWLVYRSNEHCYSMLHDVFTRLLHNQWRLDNAPVYDCRQNPLKLLQEKYNDPSLRFVTAVTRDDADSKSGYSMVRLLNHKFQASTKWNIKNDKIEECYNNGIRTFIYVDDIIGSGEQILGVLRESQIKNYEGIYVYVCVCAAHEYGIEEILKEFPYVKILAAELIPRNTDIFTNIYEVLGYENRDELRKWYEEFMKNKGARGTYNIYGRGDLGLVYAFQDNTPNNSLPILHFHNENLSMLLNKRG